MIVKIGNQIFSSSDQAISVYLSDEEKTSLKVMMESHPEKHFVSSAPNNLPTNEFDDFVRLFKQQIIEADNGAITIVKETE